MASNSIQMKKENSIKIIISKDYWKIDRNLKCKITTLSGSNFLNLLMDRQKYTTRECVNHECCVLLLSNRLTNKY